MIPLPSRASGSGGILAVAEVISVAEALEATVVKALYLLRGLLSRPRPWIPLREGAIKAYLFEQVSRRGTLKLMADCIRPEEISKSLLKTSCCHMHLLDLF